MPILSTTFPCIDPLADSPTHPLTHSPNHRDKPTHSPTRLPFFLDAALPPNDFVRAALHVFDSRLINHIKTADCQCAEPPLRLRPPP
jgi:hypothetical protein